MSEQAGLTAAPESTGTEEAKTAQAAATDASVDEKKRLANQKKKQKRKAKAQAAAESNPAEQQDQMTEEER